MDLFSLESFIGDDLFSVYQRPFNGFLYKLLKDYHHHGIDRVDEMMSCSCPKEKNNIVCNANCFKSYYLTHMDCLDAIKDRNHYLLQEKYGSPDNTMSISLLMKYLDLSMHTDEKFVYDKLQSEKCLCATIKDYSDLYGDVHECFSDCFKNTYMIHIHNLKHIKFKNHPLLRSKKQHGAKETKA